MTYEQYCAHAKEKKFQPLGIEAFNAMIKIGYDFINNRFK